MKGSVIPNILEIVEKMKKMGLWPRQLNQPDPQTVQRIYRLEEDILERTKELSLPDDNPEGRLDNERINYHVESRKKREKVDEKRKVGWVKFNKSNFTHLGKGVSNFLNLKETDIKLLEEHNLPIITDANTLSKLIKLPIKNIKWMAYHRRTSRTNHYVDFKIAKKSGGYRNISRPKPILKSVQLVIKNTLLDKIPMGEHIFGFRKGISIFDHALVHCGAKVIINFDLKDFFPSISFNQVRKAFMKLGYSGEISTVLSLLTTKQSSKRVEIDNKTYFTYSSNRYLPQGASTSPIISNLIAEKLDSQLLRRSESFGFKYTRYADDLSFSSRVDKPNIKGMIYMINKTVELHGYKINKNKTNVLFDNNSQNITGLIINSGQPKIPRVWRRKLRAAIHNFSGGKDQDPSELVRILSSVNYLKTTHPYKIDKYLKIIEDTDVSKES
jgi:hypothetical protein